MPIDKRLIAHYCYTILPTTVNSPADNKDLMDIEKRIRQFLVWAERSGFELKDIRTDAKYDCIQRLLTYL